MQIEWWYWIIAGFCLIGLELIVPSFTISWFGIGALAVGLLSGLWPGIPVAGQVALWIAASISFTIMWFRYLKPKGDRMRSETSTGGIVGESGVIVLGTEEGHGRGVVKFPDPVLGADQWGCRADETLHVGDRVRIVAIEGEMLKVEVI